MAAGIHGDSFGTPTMTGSLVGGNLVLWTAEAGTASSVHWRATGTRHVLRFIQLRLTRYDIVAGPIPASGWNQSSELRLHHGAGWESRELRTEVEIGRMENHLRFGRANRCPTPTFKF